MKTEEQVRNRLNSLKLKPLRKQTQPYRHYMVALEWVLSEEE